nr:hypothetical protein [Chroococcidiopsis sp. CCMEE 29]
MEFHRGRLIDHVHLRVADVAVSKRFYQAVLQSLGRDIDGEGDGYLEVLSSCGCGNLYFESNIRRFDGRSHDYTSITLS